MIVIVSGLPGSGKSTLVESIAEEFNLKKIFASGILKQLKEKETANAQSAEKGAGFWESKEGKEFTKKRLQELDFDRKLDEELLRIAGEDGDLIFDSRTMPWLFKGEAFKIWLKASERTRAKRIASRDGRNDEEIIEGMRSRYESDKEIYKKLYDFDLGEDFSPFQLVIDADELTADQVSNIAIMAIKKFFGV